MSSVKMSADHHAEIKSASSSCLSSAGGLLVAAAVDDDEVLLLLPTESKELMHTTLTLIGSFPFHLKQHHKLSDIT